MFTFNVFIVKKNPKGLVTVKRYLWDRFDLIAGGV